MLRHRVKANESDRFISARSAERDKMIDRYKIKDRNNDYISNNLFTEKATHSISKSVEPKTRTPVIIRDTKMLSDKIYLSLLKTQLFKAKSGNKNSTVKKSKKSSLNLIKRRRSGNEKALQDCETPVKDNKGNMKEQNEIVSPMSGYNLNYEFSNYYTPSKTESKRSAYKKRKYDLGCDFAHSSGSQFKESFLDLINFDLSKEDSVNYGSLVSKKKISSSPYKVLDAPNLKDDFYLHLIDWSPKDLLAVGLESTVYLWESKTSTVGIVSNFTEDKVTSVAWMTDPDKLLIGLSSGKVKIWDVIKNRCMHTYEMHKERVGVFSNIPTNPYAFSSGSQDHNIHTYDIRTNLYCQQFLGHSQEVCGLKWSNDGRMLASGGNDNKLILWTLRKEAPESKFSSHQSAVKAIGWSPHKFGLLASGGGTQDRTIKFWNTNLMKMIDSIDTTSQVCNMAFSKITNELVTTHGYSDNLILLWNLDSMEVIATLKGHRDRVIYLSTSPDERRIVTGAGDETLRFWEVFKPNEEVQASPKLKNRTIR